ncbi:hypothetical protein [Limnoglobus roseus]|uniref:Uncharacterized protein n=1 Tax=Limnoglobus roseus TaxID=2598579 RepID=A0A5C1APJ8_9BACT|nr:hypothetical protein [Limnoglobus roseus]QEL19134.1 hypothetical protein PX52LOC_06192 [Limnoglobus roseus]
MCPAFMVLLAVAPVAASAPVPKGAKRADYFPLAVGHRWEYTGDNPHTTEVTGEEVSADGKTIDFTVKMTGTDGGVLTRVFRRSDEGVQLIRNGTGDKLNEPFRAPVTFLPLTLKVKDKWQRVFDTGTPPTITYAFEVRPAEQVKVNGQTYTATPVKYYADKAGGGRAGTTWYADGYGIVKDTGASYEGASELKAFTMGK